MISIGVIAWAVYTWMEGIGNYILEDLDMPDYFLSVPSTLHFVGFAIASLTIPSLLSKLSINKQQIVGCLISLAGLLFIGTLQHLIAVSSLTNFYFVCIGILTLAFVRPFSLIVANQNLLAEVQACHLDASQDEIKASVVGII